MSYDPKLKVLFMAPTRDGLHNPSHRLADKHSRLFHGKTLDEWFMIRCWSSKYCTHWALVGETPEHCARLKPMADRYGGEILCRPEHMLHPFEDTGGVPMRFGVHEMWRRHGHYNMLMQTFVVNPCIPPGMYDKAIEEFLLLNMDVETSAGVNALTPVCHAQSSWLEETPSGRVKWVGPVIGNTGKCGTRWKSTQGWSVCREDYVELAWLVTLAGVNVGFLTAAQWESGMLKMPVPEWTDIHIDTQEDWDLAEWQFGHYIGDENKAYNAYDEYRNSWLKENG